MLHRASSLAILPIRHGYVVSDGGYLLDSLEPERAIGCRVPSLLQSDFYIVLRMSECLEAASDEAQAGIAAALGELLTVWSMW